MPLIGLVGCRGHGTAALHAGSYPSLRRPMPSFGRGSDGHRKTGGSGHALCAGLTRRDGGRRMGAQWSRPRPRSGEGALAVGSFLGGARACKGGAARGKAPGTRGWVSSAWPGAGRCQSACSGMPTPWSPRQLHPGWPRACLTLSGS